MPSSAWARFTRYDVILAGLRFQDLYLWLMFGTAVVTAAAGLRLLRAGGLRTLLGGEPIAWTPTPGQPHHTRRMSFIIDRQPIGRLGSSLRKDPHEPTTLHRSRAGL